MRLARDHWCTYSKGRWDGGVSGGHSEAFSGYMKVLGITWMEHLFLCIFVQQST